MNIPGVKMIKAIGYIRVSTDEQAKEGMSLENQKEKIRSYCDLKDLELLEIVEDAGISAKNLRRPEVRIPVIANSDSEGSRTAVRMMANKSRSEATLFF